MTKPIQRRAWASTMQLRASAGLTLVVTLTTSFLATQPARAQTYAVLYSFTGGEDGGNPEHARLVLDAKGNLFGTTRFGGDISCGCGVVFKLDTTDKETVLHAFTNSPDGATPDAAVTRDKAGNLYGTTLGGGTNKCRTWQCGTLFKLNATGMQTILHNFKPPTGKVPAGVLRDKAVIYLELLR